MLYFTFYLNILTNLHPSCFILSQTKTQTSPHSPLTRCKHTGVPQTVNHQSHPTALITTAALIISGRNLFFPVRVITHSSWEGGTNQSLGSRLNQATHNRSNEETGGPDGMSNTGRLHVPLLIQQLLFKLFPAVDLLLAGWWSPSWDKKEEDREEWAQRKEDLQFWG